MGSCGPEPWIHGRRRGNTWLKWNNNSAASDSAPKRDPERDAIERADVGDAEQPSGGRNAEAGRVRETERAEHARSLVAWRLRESRTPDRQVDGSRDQLRHHVEDGELRHCRHWIH